MNHPNVNGFDERWIKPGGVVPVDIPTTSALVQEVIRLRALLDTRPRTEFVAVGWWSGKQALWEPGMEPVQGALLFRPVSGTGVLK